MKRVHASPLDTLLHAMNGWEYVIAVAVAVAVAVYVVEYHGE
jgi:hypothetical protein